MGTHSYPRPMRPLAAAFRCAVASLSLLGALALAPAGAGIVNSASAATTLRPVILSVTVSTPQGLPLPALGARVVVTVRVRNATACTFLRQRIAFSSLYPLKTVGCASGRASVIVPPIANAYEAPVRLTYAVRARGAGAQWVQRGVTVAQAAGVRKPPPTTTTPPPTTTTPPPPTTTPPIVPPSAPTITQTSNWSGYVIPSSTALVTAVSGAWTVPTLDCSVTPNGGAAIWVGIGGWNWPTGGNSGALLQTGVTSDCVGGVQQNRGWVEEYPSNPNRAVNFLGFPVSPGDSIQASVFQGGGGAWETRVDNLTTGLSGVMVTGSGWGVMADAGDGTFLKQGSTAGLSYSGGYTAEWIVEAYTQDDAVVPLADYGTVTFTDLRTSLSPWYLTANEGVAMTQNGVVVSTPSPPSNNGFSISYTG